MNTVLGTLAVAGFITSAVLYHKDTWHYDGEEHWHRSAFIFNLSMILGLAALTLKAG